MKIAISSSGKTMVKGQTIIEHNSESKAGHTVKEIWNALSNKLDL